jgi:hypothetical protein
MVGWACEVRPPHGPLGSPIDMAADGPADNSFCYVCHVNFKNETMSKCHQKSAVGCMTCHGFSDNHSSDEDGLTPPQIMFPKQKVNASCIRCHNGYMTLDAPAQEALLKGSSQKYCTDCHGEHRQAVRTRRWDKATGKLIYDDGVRMTRGSGMNVKPQ